MSRFTLIPRWAALVAALIGGDALALDPDERPVNYTVSHWHAERGLPHNAIKKILQTRDGYLWIGTQRGLARFDGLTFTNFTTHNTPGIPANQITSLAETSDGSLWIGTATGVGRYHEGKFTTYGPDDGVRSGSVINALFVAPDGSLWIGGRYGITRWVDGRFINDIDTSGHDLIGLRNITDDTRGAVWIAIGTAGLRFMDGRLETFNATHGLPAQGIQMFRCSEAGEVFAVTQLGLFRLEGDRFVAFEHNAELASLRVSTVIFDRAGSLWIGSAGGLDRFANGQIAAYAKRDGSKPEVVDSLYEDREGSLWVGTANGLFRFLDRRAHSLGADDGTAGTLITTVGQSRDGAVWVGYWANGLDRQLAGKTTHLAPGAPLSHETVTCIYQAPDGTMWFGNRGSSIDRLDGDTVTTFVYASGVATSRYVSAMHADPGGRFFLSIASRGLLELRDGKIEPVPEAGIVSGDTMWSLRRMRDGTLIMGGSQGLYEWRSGGDIQLVKWRDLPQPVVVRDILEEEDGTRWLATDGHGLVRWKDGVVRAFGAREGMVDDTLFSVIDDGLGSLWVSSARGIARVRKQELAELGQGRTSRLNCLVFGRSDGLLSGASSGGSPAAVLHQNGQILMATDHGVAVIDPRKIQLNMQPPAVVIEGLVVDDTELSVGGPVVVPPGANRLEVRYTALSLVAPERSRFRYQLKGSDSRWIEAGHERTAYYTHLAPGAYTFHVLASNNDGIWNETGATLAITLLPHYYQTLWFRLGVAGLGVGLVVILVGLRLSQLKRKQRDLARVNAELDQRVRERTAELSRSNEELQQRELLFRLIFEHAPVGISWRRTDLGAEYHFNDAFRRILDLPAETLPDNSLLAELVHPDDAARQVEQEKRIHSGETDSYALEQRFVRKDGRQVWGLLAVAVVRDQSGNVIQVIGLLEEITARKEAEQELAATYKRLMDASRIAGMAEVATGVLHNVGNVLNSVNVSATMLGDGLRASKVEGVGRVAALLQQHADHLATYLSEDPKGRLVAPYLATLSTDLVAERRAFIAEVDSLRSNVDHIHEIVTRQQSYAQMKGLLEKLAPDEIMEDALRMNLVGLTRHGIEVIREYSPTAMVVTERHKVLQILINLIQNAKHAVNEAGPAKKWLRIAVEQRDQTVRFTVADNGVGIPAENLTRIFNQGFTTRPDGHGFGLHSSANAAGEIDGTIQVTSEGPGRGATFTLEIPLSRNSTTPNNQKAETPLAGATAS